MLNEVATDSSTITRDTLPNLYAQFYKKGGETRLYYNVDNTITSFRIEDTTDTVGANQALSNLASVAINTSLISDTDDTDDLGSSGKQWKDLYIDGVAYIDQLGEDLDFNDNEAKNFIVENRTDDTGMTVTGQMWFRTDA